MIYFDNSATTGQKPIEVLNAVNNSLRNFSANPGRSGHEISQRAALEVYQTREKLSDFFGADGAENVVFTANCTTSINFVLKGILSDGDHIIISNLEHNAVMRPLKKMNKISYSIAQISDDENKTIQNFSNLIKSNTRMIFCTSASNVTGKILPLKLIGNLCKKHGLLFGVDAAQGAGIIPINMQQMNIDFLCIAPHKGLYAPMGIGVLIARKPLKNTVIEGGTGTNSIDFSQPDIMPEMLESGTINLPAISGIKAGVDFVNRYKNCIYTHEMYLVNYLLSGLRKIKKGIVYTNPIKNSYVPVLPFNIEGKTSDETASILNKNGFALRAGLHCAPTAHEKLGTLNIGAVRFSPSIFNNEKQVVLLIKNLEKI